MFLRNVIRLSAAAVGCFVLTAPVLAHHNFAAQYDVNQPITIDGVVTKIDWMNPHVYFYIDVENKESGEVENWALEMGPPHMLQKRGWKRNSMKLGDAVHVEATRARNGSLNANARKVTLSETGEELGTASSEETARP